jgi:hypothetical protein
MSGRSAAWKRTCLGRRWIRNRYLYPGPTCQLGFPSFSPFFDRKISLPATSTY